MLTSLFLLQEKPLINHGNNGGGEREKRVSLNLSSVSAPPEKKVLVDVINENSKPQKVIENQELFVVKGTGKGEAQVV